MTLKSLFLEHVQADLERRGQMSLEFQEKTGTADRPAAAKHD
jgi:hypothetical protein